MTFYKVLNLNYSTLLVLISINYLNHMKKIDPFENLGFECTLTRKAFFSAMEKRLKGSGMKAAQYLAIGQLLSFGSLTQSQLSENLCVALATIKGLVDSMERDGLVIREIDLKDVHVKHIVPTNQAAEIWEHISHYSRELLEQAYQGISDEELEITKRVLLKSHDNLKLGL